MKTVQEIIDVIFEKRADFRKDQATLAKAMNMSRQSLNQYLSRKKIPLKYLIPFCEHNGYSLDLLITEGMLLPRNQPVVSEKNNEMLFTCPDSSMEPTMRAGDNILVDTDQNYFNTSGLYLMKLQSSLMIRRLTELFDGAEERILFVSAEHSPYPSERIPLKKLADRIVGKCREIRRAT